MDIRTDGLRVGLREWRIIMEEKTAWNLKPEIFHPPEEKRSLVHARVARHHPSGKMKSDVGFEIKIAKKTV